MTTDTTPTPEDQRIIRADQPAEILAAARVAFGTVPRDRLLLVGHSGHHTRPVLTSSPLTELVAESGREHLEHHLSLMREKGCTAALAMVVLRDGSEHVDPIELEDWERVGAALLLDTAHHLLPDPFDLYPLWVLGAGTARQVVLEHDEVGDGMSLWVSPVQQLEPFDHTRAAMDAVLEGRSVRPDLPGREALAEVGRRLRLAPIAASPADTSDLLTRTRAALSRIGARRAGSTGSDEQFMTDCEQVSTMLSALAIDAVHWELLAMCVDHGSPTPVDREMLLQELTSDPSRRPHEDVCAGGGIYSDLLLLREAAAAAMHLGHPAGAASAASAWRGLTAVLALLAWWNHRFSGAGEMVDDLLRHDPSSTLAPLLATMIDTPIFPAWWPEA